MWFAIGFLAAISVALLVIVTLGAYRLREAMRNNTTAQNDLTQATYNLVDIIIKELDLERH
jgi:hypothetical protein